MSTAVIGEIVSLLSICPFIENSPKPFVYLGHFRPKYWNINISHSFDKITLFSQEFPFLSFFNAKYTWIYHGHKT